MTCFCESYIGVIFQQFNLQYCENLILDNLGGALYCVENHNLKEPRKESHELDDEYDEYMGTLVNFFS